MTGGNYEQEVGPILPVGAVPCGLDDGQEASLLCMLELTASVVTLRLFAARPVSRPALYC